MVKMGLLTPFIFGALHKHQFFQISIFWKCVRPSSGPFTGLLVLNCHKQVKLLQRIWSNFWCFVNSEFQNNFSDVNSSLSVRQCGTRKRFSSSEPFAPQRHGLDLRSRSVHFLRDKLHGDFYCHWGAFPHPGAMIEGGSLSVQAKWTVSEWSFPWKRDILQMKRVAFAGVLCETQVSSFVEGGKKTYSCRWWSWLHVIWNFCWYVRKLGLWGTKQGFVYHSSVSRVHWIRSMNRPKAKEKSFVYSLQASLW